MPAPSSAARGVGRDLRAGLGEGRVGDAGGQAGARLDRHVQAEGLVLLHRLRRGRNARLSGRRSFRTASLHGSPLNAPTMPQEVRDGKPAGPHGLRDFAIRGSPRVRADFPTPAATALRRERRHPRRRGAPAACRSASALLGRSPRSALEQAVPVQLRRRRRNTLPRPIAARSISRNSRGGARRRRASAPYAPCSAILRP